VFQCNPQRYDVVGALRDDAVKTWQANQHKEDIHPNDRVIIWVTGEAAGCYALATVTSEVRTITEDPKEATYRKQPIGNSAVDGVTIRIDTNLWDTPVLKESITGQPAFRDFPAGRQGTNLVATKAYYEGILALARGRKEMRYWLYAPGQDAKYWDECWRKSIMLYGADEISDLSAFANKAEIEKAFKTAKKLKHRPTNDARGAWEFAHVLSPGDVIIAKKGSRQFVGYGVVSGPYRYEAERTTFRNIRSVRWVKKGIWDKKKGGPIVQKALTDITKYPEYVQELQKLICIEDTDPRSSVPLALNTILYGPPGTGKTYALRNEYMQRFTESAAVMSKEDFVAELVADLAWWQVITMVMLDLKTSNVSGILAHPLMQARIRRANNQTSPKTSFTASGSTLNICFMAAITGITRS
jgi:hypothetical protein